MNLRKIVSCSAVVAALAASQALATIVTLDPAAPNTGAVGGTVISATNGPFPTDKGTTNFASFLDIGSLPGGAPASFTETGFLDVNEWSITPNTTSGIHTNWFLYATFTITGNGTWVGNTYLVNLASVVVNATVHASPGSQTTSGLQYCDPTSGTFGVCTAGSQDFTLGTASLNLPVSAFANVVSGTNLASEQFNAILNFNPAAGTTGATGFWQAPIPFNVQLNTSATGNAGSPGTTFTTSGGHTLILTSVTSGPNPIGAGSGNVIFQQVPEPSTLVLLGAAFLVLGVVVSRNRSA